MLKGFILSFLILISLSFVFAIGFHPASEILSGTFNGSYSFYSNSQSNILNIVGGSSVSPSIKILDGLNQYWRIGSGQSSYTDGRLFIATETGPKITILRNGNIGINGINNPSSMLEFQGISNPPDGEYASIKAFSNGNTLIWGHTNTKYDNAIGALNGGGQPFISFFSYHSNNSNLLKRSSDSHAPGMFLYDTGGNLHYLNAPSGVQDADIDNWVYRFKISNDGNVGIGTTSPIAKLSVAGNITAEAICDENGANCNDLSSGLGGPSPKAYVLFDGTDGTIRNSYNVNTVARTNTGRYTLTFQNALADTDYVVVGSVSKQASQTNARIFTYIYESMTTNGFDIEIKDSAEVFRDQNRISIIVY